MYFKYVFQLLDNTVRCPST